MFFTAELKHKPEVTMTTRLLKDLRLVSLSWKVRKQGQNLKHFRAVQCTRWFVNFVKSSCSSAVLCLWTGLSTAPQPMPEAAAVGGVTYMLNDTQSSCGCPCGKRKDPFKTDKQKYDMYVPYSAVNISVTARNPTGDSPPATVQVPAAADLKGTVGGCAWSGLSHAV